MPAHAGNLRSDRIGFRALGATVNDDVVTVPRKTKRDGAPDAATGTGDEYALPAHLPTHATMLFSRRCGSATNGFVSSHA